MEIKREKLDGPPADFRARQLTSRELLRGDLEGEDLERYVEQNIMTTTLEKAVSWSQATPSVPDDLQACLLRDRDH